MSAERGIGLHAARLVLPAVWLGMLLALGFVETPLKFLAPGMTLEVALGVGRLVLTFADVAGLVLLLVITILALLRPRAQAPARWVLGGLWLALLVQVAIVRPLLNAQSDQVRAGAESAGSGLHLVYIAIDVVLAGLLLALCIVTARERRPTASPVEARPS